jgi:Cu-Zn family superoxide dismutase
MRAGAAIVTLVAGVGTVPGAADAQTARADLTNARGQAVGQVTLEQTPNGVLLRATLVDIPAGERAIHLHETGRCQPPDFESAGGHLALRDQRHGIRAPGGPHAGDLPNLHVPDSGRLTVELFAPRVSLAGGEAALLDGDGAAIVIHEKADDYRSDPAGDAGGRIACGEIGAAGR